jgi:uncharacterized paraquat-inducible protein A
MGYLLLWMAFGIVCAVIAPGRGRGSLAWFFIGLLTGVFGLVALVAMPNLTKNSALLLATGRRTAPPQGRRTPSQATPAPIDTYPCPRCAETIKKAAKVCRFCNHEFPPEPPTVKPLPIHTVGTTRFARDIAKPGELVVCSSCNIEADAENHKCPYCNTSLYTRTTDAELYDRRKKEV